MFFRYFTLFLVFFPNVIYSLKLKNNSVFKTNYIFSESKNCVNTPQLSTHCLTFINGHTYPSNKTHLHQKYKTKVNLKEDKPENENFYNIDSIESGIENRFQDSTLNLDTNRITHNTLDKYNNLNKQDEVNKNEINDLVSAALKWETTKIPNPQPDLTDEEIQSIREKFLKSLEEEEQTSGQIIRKVIKEKEAQAAKEKKPKEDWKELLEEFTIEVEGKKCYGCGANLQCKNEIKRGYVAPEYFQEFKKSNLIKCKRCSSLGSGTYFLSDPSNKSSININDGIEYNEINNEISEENEHTGVSEREEILPEEMFDNTLYQTSMRNKSKQKQKQILDKEIAEKQLLIREDEIMNKIKEASTETVNIVRNMLKIKKRKKITILYIVDVIDPHIEVGLLELIKKRQEQLANMQQDQEEEEIDAELIKEKIKSRKKIKSKKEEVRSDGGIKLYLILNKIDLLPKYKKDEVIQYFRKMVNSKVDVQLKSKNVFLVSSKYNVNINLLLSVILLETKKLQNQILFIGPTNSGKSTLINAIHNILKTSNSKKSTNINKNKRNITNKDYQESSDNYNDNNCNSNNYDIEYNETNLESNIANQTDVNYIEEVESNENKELLLGKKVTSSIVPGTTLGVLGIKLGMGLKIYDTPGIFIPNSLISYLDHDNLKNVIINSIPPNKAIRLSQGHTLLIDKFVRMDVTHGRDFFVKFYLSDKLDIFVKKSHKLEKFINKHFGNQHLYYPSYYIEKTDELARHSSDTNTTSNDNDAININNPITTTTTNTNTSVTSSNSNNDSNYVNRKFEIVLEGWHGATCDLCIKGLGFLTIGGALKINFNLFTRKDVEIYLRKPMFPRNIFPFKPRKH